MSENSEIERNEMLCEHEEHCGCGCEHEHEEYEHHHHEHEDHCDCGCDHDHEEHEHHHHGHEHHHHDYDGHCDCGCEHKHEEHEHHHHHDHEEYCECGCEHEHAEHEHHHDHGEHCDCGCDHDHEEHEHHHHDHDEHCDCGCDHDHEEHKHHHEHHHEHHAAVAGSEMRVYLLENLGCAHCASKMEEKILRLPGVEDAVITYATKQLRLTAANQEKLLPEIQKICASIESQVKVVPRVEKASGANRTQTYLLENLGCAHCASKMEEKILKLPGVEDAVITYATKQLRLTAANQEKLLPEIQKICASIESQVKVVPRAEKTSGTSQSGSNPPSSAAASVSAGSAAMSVSAPSAAAAPVSAVSAPAAVSRSQTTASKKAVSKDQKELFSILAGAVLFAAGILLDRMGFQEPVYLAVFVAAYLILGWEVLSEAARNILHGQIFDENFLMSIATLGAFGLRVFGAQEYAEAVGVMLFYRIGEFFEHKAVDRSRSQIMDAVDMRPEVVNLLHGDEVQVIPAEDAQVGDVLLIRPGDRIPLDGVIAEGSSRLDTSPITGEPVPVAVAAGDKVTSGCVNTSGQLKLRVEKPLAESMVTRILDSVENAAASKPKIDRFITRFSRIYTPCVVLIALATAILPSLVTGNWRYWIYTALTFLVMSCPCALVLSVPLAFFSGIGAGSRKGILFKGGIAIEALGKLKAVIMDKTGTITEGNFLLQRVVTAGTIGEDELLRLTASCEQNSTHPIAHSIVEAAAEKSLALETPQELEEISGHGIVARLGAGQVLCGNRKLMERYQIAMPELTGHAYGAEVFVAVGGALAGYLLISDTIKADAKTAVSRLRTMGLRTVMLTGDSQDSAQAVAKETGIDDVYARLLPQDKLDVLNRVRTDHGTVMFVGDGINDAPVLAGADVGAAMGSGADAAIEAADAVFMNSSVESIPQAIAIARRTNRIAVQNIVFALTIKIAVMILGLLGFANMWMAVFADTGVAMLCVLNSIRALYTR